MFCSDNMAYDWDGFQQIPGCASGVHSLEDPGISIAPSPNAPSASDAAKAVAESEKSSYVLLVTRSLAFIRATPGWRYELTKVRSMSTGSDSQ